MQARVSVAAGRRLRQQLEQSPALRDVLHHPAAIAARRATARTCRQLAPRTADRLIADLKGTEPLLASVRAERAAAARPGRRAGAPCRSPRRCRRRPWSAVCWSAGRPRTRTARRPTW
ncbi:hypothetical protein ACFQ0M_32765 [Kitasatospora aburaviensis]